MIATNNKTIRSKNEAKDLWEFLIKTVNKENPFLHSYLDEGILLDYDHRWLYVGYLLRNTDHMEMVDNKKNHQTIEAIFQRLGYRELRLHLSKINF